MIKYLYTDKQKYNKEYQTEWRKNNKEKIKGYVEKRKNYYQENRQDRIDYQRYYHENNLEKVLETRKKHYQKKREILLEKHYCDCGGKYAKTNKKTHEKSQRHLRFIGLLK